jgi:hypothetical protein
MRETKQLGLFQQAEKTKKPSRQETNLRQLGRPAIGGTRRFPPPSHEGFSFIG